VSSTGRAPEPLDRTPAETRCVAGFARRVEAVGTSRGSRDDVAGRDFCLLAADRQALSPLGPPALQHEAPVLGAHAHQEPVGSLPAPRIWLKRPLSLHVPSLERNPN